MIIKKDFPLSQILWYKTGGKAQYLVEAKNAEDVKEALKFIEENKIQKVLFIGLGSNMIFPDEYFHGAVVRIAQEEKLERNEFQIKGEFITLFAGVILDNFIKCSLNNNLVGLEWAGGLPGTVGSGIRGNVGAFGKEIKDSLFSVDILEKHTKGYAFKTLKKRDLHFSYRNSLIKENKNMIIVSATFQLHSANPDELVLAKNIYKNNIDYRKKQHPLEYPTCGSVFKNISKKDEVEKIISVWPDTKKLIDTKWHGKISMGFIIERLGFSGFRIGNMQVSEKHANFIVNLGEGKSSEVLTIIKEIQNKAHSTFGFTPEVEVEIIQS